MTFFKHLRLLLLIAFSVAISHLDALAYDFQVNGIYYNKSGNTASVTYKDGNHNSYSGNIEIPETVSYGGTTYSVTSIGDRAFYFCDRLTSVTIPNSVTSIGEEAFAYCSLSSLTFPQGITEISKGVCDNCQTLKSVNIPEGVVKIGEYAFIRTKLKDIKFPSTLEVIESGAFWATYIDDLYIPGNVKIIGRSAFNAAIWNSITLEEGVEEIDLYAFKDCAYGSLYIPSTVKSIGEGAFWQCPSSLPRPEVESIVVSLENKYYDSRDNCNAIINSATNELIFACANTTIPPTVTSIGDNAFYKCSGVTSVTIPISVKKIGHGAFCDSSGLTSVTVENPNPANIELGYQVFYDVPVNTCILYVPKGSKELYEVAEQWSSFKNIEEFEVASVLGDFDGNGSISVGDLQVMLNAILTLTPDSRFDLTGDGDVNAADIAKMIDIVMGR